MDNKISQIEEVEALSSIFESEWSYNKFSNNYSIQIRPDVELCITMDPDYPSRKPPKYELSAPSLRKKQKEHIYKEFTRIYNDSNGCPVLYEWIMRLKDILSDIDITEVRTKNKSDKSVVTRGDAAAVKLRQCDEKEVKTDLKITHGPLITDRKSTFQGHVCEITDKRHIKQFLDMLHENKKISHAKHNVIAYRLTTKKNVILQDCDDDGEEHAGSRLLHLLNVLDAKNVAVIVTRWYGGIHLGPARFKHYNNAARQALVAGGFIKS